jgi:hypothetical protein
LISGLKKELQLFKKLNLDLQEQLLQYKEKVKMLTERITLLENENARAMNDSPVETSETLVQPKKPRKEKSLFKILLSDENPDGQNGRPEFDGLVNAHLNLAATRIAFLSDKWDNDENGDRLFVYDLLRELFSSEILSTHTLVGNRKANAADKLILDSHTVHFAYEQFCKRANAFGINSEQRSKRSSYQLFRIHVSSLTKIEKMKKLQKMKKKPSGNDSGTEESNSNDEGRENFVNNSPNSEANDDTAM